MHSILDQSVVYSRKAVHDSDLYKHSFEATMLVEKVLYIDIIVYIFGKKKHRRMHVARWTYL